MFFRTSISYFLGLLLFAISLGVPTTAAPIVVEANFGEASAYKRIPPTDFVSGSLSEGWQDESAWTKSNCAYSFEKDDATGFLRVNCPREGRIHFFHPIDGFATRKFFRITLMARSPSRSELKFRIQEKGKPSSFAAVDLRLKQEWDTYAVTLAGGPADVKALGFRILSTGPGTIDIASLKLEEIPKVDYIPKTVVPTMRADKPGWLERHKRMVATLAKDKPDFVIMGDSITKAWEMEGKAAWAKYIAPLKAAPFGIAGDGVEHLLWRVENSGIGKDFQPKLVAILIGVNNLFNADAPEIAAGTKLLIAEIQQRSPSTKILLLGIFPVGEKPDDARRPMIKDVNALYGKLADQRRIFYMDIGDSFLDPNGSISKNTLFDFVHCTPKAYDIYAGKLSSKAKELMGN